MIQKGQGLSVIKNEIDWQYHISNCTVLPSQLLNLDYRLVFVILWLDCLCGRGSSSDALHKYHPRGITKTN